MKPPRENLARFQRLLEPGPWNGLPPRMAELLAIFRDVAAAQGIERGSMARAIERAGMTSANGHKAFNGLLARAERWDALHARGIAPVPGLEVRAVSTTHDADGAVQSTSVRQGLPSDLTAPTVPESHAVYDPRPGSGYLVKGTTTLLDSEGNPRAQYVMVRRDEAQREATILAFVEGLKADLPTYPPAKPTKSGAADLMNVYTITDYHFGMRAWAEETGGNWDLAIADKMLARAIAAFLEQAPRAAACVLNFGGDTLHYDSFKPLTPESGHVLDADSRMEKMVRVAVGSIRRAVSLALKRHRRVILLVQEGNHDPAASVWMRVMLAHVYAGDKRVEVVTSALPYYAIRHGAMMLGFHHGHLKKPDGLPLLFAAQFREMWGQTKVAHIHCGHQHHVYEKEHPGAMVTQHPTLAARDAYAARGGWIATRAAIAHTYHRNGYLVATTHVGAEALAA